MTDLRQKLFLAYIVARGVPQMACECLLSPLHKRREHRDWAGFARRFPAMSGFPDRVAAIDRELRPAYEAYVREVSSPWVSLTYGLARLLHDFCRQTGPQSILDLGSGFSSYVFAEYAAESEGRLVHATDEDAFWLEKTRGFLHDRSLLSHRVTMSTGFELDPDSLPDLVFLDMGDFTLRPQLIERLVPVVQGGATLFLDDLHMPGYRRFIRRLAERENLSLLSLRRHTRQRLRFAAVLLRRSTAIDAGADADAAAEVAASDGERGLAS